MPSFELTEYYFTLVSVGGEWYIVSVASWNSPENVASRISAADEMDADGITSDEMDTDEMAAEAYIDAAPTAARTASNITYDGQNAANYALAYTTQSDSDNNLQYPTYRNTFFNWSSTPCMLFASQCVWAGFGGSNTQADINNCRGMDETTPNTWWSINDDCTPSWWSCYNFRNYVINSRSATEGLQCETLYVECDQNTLYGVRNVYIGDILFPVVDSAYSGHYFVPGTKSSPFVASDLLGAVIHGKTSDGILGHAVVVTAATGITRQTLCVSAYNSCKKNVQLSLVFPSGGDYSHQDLYVTVPQTFKGGQTETTRLYAKLENAISVGTTRSLTGYATSSVLMTMRIYNEAGTQMDSATTPYANGVIVKSYTFNQPGIWRITIESTGLQTFTYLVRVV